MVTGLIRLMTDRVMQHCPEDTPLWRERVLAD
jgi:hypothetical protein